MIIRSLALAACLAVAAAPALAQEHDHTHGAGHAHGAEQAASHGHHGHAHADFDSDRLHVRVDGPAGAPDLILIPGLSSSPEVWDSTVAHLGDRYRVHRIHVQGFAGAEPKANATGPVAAPVAEEIARYIRESDLNKPAVVGHSMGGTIGMMLAARHPDAVGKLMVVDMVPFMGAMFAQPGTNPTAEAVVPVADQIHAAQANSPREQYLAQGRATVSGMINTEALRAGPLADLEASDQQVSANAFRELIVTDLRAELPKITAPVEVLYVKFNDPRMTPEITDAIYRMSFSTLPSAELTRIDDSAHFIMLDQPERFFSELDAFLAE